MPFSAGPRVCIGEKLAKMQMFLIAVNLIRNFEITLSPGEKMPGMLDGGTGVTFKTDADLKVLYTRRRAK